MSRKKRTIIAIMYDFDKTLCTKDMQEYGFIPDVGLKPKEFWNKVTEFSRTNKMDSIHAYMYLMINSADKANKSIHRNDFVRCGKSVVFFPGVDTWFNRVNEYGKKKKVQVEHYIISSGLREIIEGTNICKKFKEIYACEFFYNQNDIAIWPRSAIDYTAKTQFLFRINKGVLDVTETKALNKYMPDDEREVPFRNMIYIGDGLTDVPCMRLVKEYGGQSIVVYGSRKREAKQEAFGIVRDGRAQYCVPADYSSGKELEKLVFRIIDKIAATDIIEKEQLECEKMCKQQLCEDGFVTNN